MQSKAKFKHTFDSETQEGVYLEGQTHQVWRPVIAYPIVGGLFKPYRCGCGKRFKSKQAYDEHYIYWAVWQNESGYIPSLLQKEAERLQQLTESQTNHQPKSKLAQRPSHER